MIHRRLMLAAALAAPWAARAHHGWSSFDQTRPIWLEGRATQVAWRNPHAELKLELPAEPRLPADLASRALPAQAAGVDGQALLAAARLPRRRDKVWLIELAPLTRLSAWKMPEIKSGAAVAALGFTFTDEKGDAVLRAEYVWLDGQVYGLRSSPA